MTYNHIISTAIAHVARLRSDVVSVGLPGRSVPIVR